MRSLVILANVATPYRVHFHARLAAALAPARLVSVFFSSSQFFEEQPLPASIGAVHLDHGRVHGHLAEALWYPRAFARVLREERPDAVVVNGWHSPLLVRAIFHCARRGLPVFVSGDSNVWGDVRGDAPRLVKQVALRSLLGASQGVLSMGRAGDEFFRRYGAERIYRVPYDADYDYYAVRDEGDVLALRASLGLDETRRAFTFAGRFVAVKGIDTLLDAFASIAATRPAWDLILAGAGVEEGALRSRIPRALEGRVRFAGLCNVPRMRALYHASDVFVLPSRFEPWGVVVTEALAAGVPVVSTTVCGAAIDLVHPGENGELAPPDDVPALSRALLAVSSDPERYRAAVPALFAKWREENDPVKGVLEAIASCRG